MLSSINKSSKSISYRVTTEDGAALPISLRIFCPECFDLSILTLEKSLNFLSLDGLYKSMGYEKRNQSYPQFTDHCFTGDYPIKPIDVDNKNFLNKEISSMHS